MTKYLLTILIGFCYFVMASQTVAITVSDVKVSKTKFKPTGILIKEHIEKSLLNHDFITLVDRDITHITEAEREIQKNASFMDGKYVAQDKAVGAEWIFEMLFDDKSKVLTLQILDVETDEIFYGQEYAIKHFLLSDLSVERPRYFGRYIEEKVAEIMIKQDIGSRNIINIVEISESNKDKAKEVILLCAQACNLKRKMTLEVFIEEERPKSLVKKKTKIGLLEIIYVESDQIYQAKVKKGHKEILKYFKDKKNLICKNEL